MCLTREGAAQNNFLLSKRGKARHRQELQNAVKGKYPKADTVGSPDEEKFFVQFWTKVFTEKYKSLASGYFHDPQKNQQELYVGWCMYVYMYVHVCVCVCIGGLRALVDACTDTIFSTLDNLPWAFVSAGTYAFVFFFSQPWMASQQD